jgi:hypothetical protein
VAAATSQRSGCGSGGGRSAGSGRVHRSLLSAAVDRRSQEKSPTNVAIVTAVLLAHFVVARINSGRYVPESHPACAVVSALVSAALQPSLRNRSALVSCQEFTCVGLPDAPRCGTASTVDGPRRRHRGLVGVDRGGWARHRGRGADALEVEQHQVVVPRFVVQPTTSSALDWTAIATNPTACLSLRRTGQVWLHGIRRSPRAASSPRLSVWSASRPPPCLPTACRPTGLHSARLRSTRDPQPLQSPVCCHRSRTPESDRRHTNAPSDPAGLVNRVAGTPTSRAATSENLNLLARLVQFIG